MTTLENEVLEKFRQLDSEQQEQVAVLVRSLLTPKGVSGSSLLRFVGRVPSDDLERFEEAIEMLEQVEPDAW